MIYHFTRKNENSSVSWQVFPNFFGKNEYVIHIKNLKQALNHELVFK